MLFRDFDRIDLQIRRIFWPNNLSQPPRSKIKQTKNNLKTLNLVPIFVLGLLDDFLRKKICHFKMAAEEKLGVPSNEFFAAVKYHAVGSLQDQVSLSFCDMKSRKKVLQKYSFCRKEAKTQFEIRNCSDLLPHCKLQYI